MTPKQRQRAIQRLEARCAGRFDSLHITMELRHKVLRSEFDGHRTTTTYSRHPTPVWVVFLRRPGRKHWTWDLLGFNDNILVENEDLDQALLDALDKSNPEHVYLDERVWQHQDFLDFLDFLPLTPEQIEELGALP